MLIIHLSWGAIMAAPDLKTDLKIHILIRCITSQMAINGFLRSMTVTLKVVFQYA